MNFSYYMKVSGRKIVGLFTHSYLIVPLRTLKLKSVSIPKDLIHVNYTILLLILIDFYIYISDDLHLIIVFSIMSVTRLQTILV